MCCCWSASTKQKESGRKLKEENCPFSEKATAIASSLSHFTQKKKSTSHQNLMPPCLSLISSFCIAAASTYFTWLNSTKEEPKPSSLLFIRGCLSTPVRPSYNKIKFRPSKPAKCLLTTAADPPTCHRSTLILLQKPVSNNPIVLNLATINHLFVVQANMT